LLKDSRARRIDYLRVSVTDRCNLRCIYCMPPGGVPRLSHEEILTYEEILRFVGVAARAGIGKVRLTGGEPLVRKGLPCLVGELASRHPNLDLSLTTNGSLLAEHAGELRRAGLRRVNISIDSLDREKYRMITRGGELNRALEGLEAALEEGLDPVKVNVVTLKHVNEEVEGFAELAWRLPVHVRFIEYMSPCGACDPDLYVSSESIRKKLEALGPLEKAPPPPGAGPAVYFRFPGARGTLGFISPVSSHICGNCNRMRLTADGMLKSCLFSPEEVDIKSLLRSGASEGDILESIRSCLGRKGSGREWAANPSRAMFQVGG
jgi:cyclic pyranopterin phosphate synthase